MYQIVVAAILGAVLGEGKKLIQAHDQFGCCVVFGTSCQTSQDYSCQFTDRSNNGSKYNCSTYTYTDSEEESNIIWVDIISFENCNYSSLLLTNITEHNQNEICNCHITTNTAPKLTLDLVTRLTLAISIEAGGIVCDISCNFNVWRPQNCSNYSALASLTEHRLSVCHHKNYSVSINITFIDKMIYINNESQIINQCSGKSNYFTITTA